MLSMAKAQRIEVKDHGQVPTELIAKVKAAEFRQENASGLVRLWRTFTAKLNALPNRKLMRHQVCLFMSPVNVIGTLAAFRRSLRYIHGRIISSTTSGLQRA